MNVRDLFDLKGKAAVVTGGSIGPGNQIARGLAELVNNAGISWGANPEDMSAPPGTGRRSWM